MRRATAANVPTLNRLVTPFGNALGRIITMMGADRAGRLVMTSQPLAIRWAKPSLNCGRCR